MKFAKYNITAKHRILRQEIREADIRRHDHFRGFGFLYVLRIVGPMVEAMEPILQFMTRGRP